MKGNFTPCWISLNNSEAVGAVTLALCSIQWHFIRHILAKISISYSPQSPDIRQNSDGGIFDFRISGQSLIKENCHNSRTSNDTDMKLGPITKLDKRNRTTTKKFGNEVMSKILTPLLFLWFMANLEQSGSPILDA